MNEPVNFYTRLPKKVIYISFLLTILLDFIPFSGNFFYWIPEFSALMLFYWLINRPDSINIGAAFLLGILVDIGTAAPLAQHALAYMFASYVIIQNRRQMLYNYGIQAIMVFAALMISEIILTLIRWRFTHHFSGWLVFLSPLVGALLWPMFNKIMVFVLNLRFIRR